MLTLSEKLLLLALHDERGNVVLFSSTTLPYGLGSALLLELRLTKLIDLIDNKIAVINTDKANSQLINEVLRLFLTLDKLDSLSQPRHPPRNNFAYSFAKCSVR